MLFALIRICILTLSTTVLFTLTFQVKGDTVCSVIEMFYTCEKMQISNYLGVLDPENFTM